MPTPIFVCGSECGIAARGALSAGTEHWSAVTATGTFSSVTSGPSPMRSARCYRLLAAGQFVAADHTLVSVVASPATLVARYYLYFTTFPTSNVDLLHYNGSVSGFTWGATFNAVAQEIRADVNVAGVPVVTGRWYCVDQRTVFAAGAHTLDVWVNGRACPQRTANFAAESVSAIRIGTTVNNTFDMYYDDIVVSATGADFPIMPGTVHGLYPTADGTHGGGWASGTFGKGASGATAAANTDTDLWQSLDNPLTTTAGGSWVSDLTGTVLTNYVEFRNDVMPISDTPIHGAMLVVTTHSASTLANNFNFAINDGAGHTATLISVVDLSEVTITVPVVVRNTDANGVAWTVASLAANRNRFSSTATNPDVFLDGFCWEVAYPRADDSIYPYIASLVNA